MWVSQTGEIHSFIFIVVYNMKRFWWLFVCISHMLLAALRCHSPAIVWIFSSAFEIALQKRNSSDHQPLTKLFWSACLRWIQIRVHLIGIWTECCYGYGFGAELKVDERTTHRWEHPPINSHSHINRTVNTIQLKKHSTLGQCTYLLWVIKYENIVFNIYSNWLWVLKSINTIIVAVRNKEWDNCHIFRIVRLCLYCFCTYHIHIIKLKIWNWMLFVCIAIENGIIMKWNNVNWIEQGFIELTDGDSGGAGVAAMFITRFDIYKNSFLNFFIDTPNGLRLV